jgi:hypothetical protein
MQEMENEPVVVVDLVFRSASGRSLSEKEPGLTAKDLADYQATEETQERAVRALRELGFDIVGPPSPYGVTISGPAELVRESFGEAQLHVPDALSPFIESARVPPRGEYYKRPKTGF